MKTFTRISVKIGDRIEAEVNSSLLLSLETFPKGKILKLGKPQKVVGVVKGLSKHLDHTMVEFESKYGRLNVWDDKVVKILFPKN